MSRFWEIFGKILECASISLLPLEHLEMNCFREGGGSKIRLHVTLLRYWIALQADDAKSRIISTTILANLEEGLKINITDNLGLIAGTSTGGTIALRLSQQPINGRPGRGI